MRVEMVCSGRSPHIGEPEFPATFLADYDAVRLTVLGDDFDVPHLFFTGGLLAVGVGHVDCNQAASGISIIRFT